MRIVTFGEVERNEAAASPITLSSQGASTTSVLQIIERSATARLVRRIVWAILPAPIL